MRIRINTENIFLSPFAKALVDAITSTWFHIILLAFCVVLGFVFYNRATEQFSPEVHKIIVESESNTSYPISGVQIQAALNSSIIKDYYGVNQFFDVELMSQYPYQSDSLQGAVLDDNSEPNYTDHNIVKVTFSGRDMYNPDYPDTLWHIVDKHDGIGKFRCRETNESTFEIEQLSVGGRMHESIMFHGNDIFYNSKSRNPYIAFYLTLKGLWTDESMASGISLYYTVGDEKDSNGDFETENTKFKHPINIVSSYPPPTTISPILLTYDKEAFKKIREDGLYLILEDLTAKKDRDKESFFYSLLLGAIISWAIQLIVSIVHKWKSAFSTVHADK